MNSAALRPHALPPRTLTRLTPADCTATHWSTAKAKADAGNRVLAFIESGLHPDSFTDDLYRTCSQHLFAHIAHFNRHGFADVWFTTPDDKAAFIRHAINARSGGDPAWTWSDVEQHLQDTLADHPRLQEPSAWTGATRPHDCPSCHCTPQPPA
ncbi:hypothetical protein OG883_42500 [Streptomyces sp. NBC_01142]|uniref:hypothetical protein n=1 Tax=Streptomyces sp. NBC_01142 TaxID=2975865 RepID=UPI002254371C|nr:hypothetical protein [Streptomyces sp. NBC_01142]MCX4826315.1 hypothetical protein [Streptomyces sp. NBC_01142]